MKLRTNGLSSSSMVRSSRVACIGMLLLILGSAAMPVLAADGACVGMSCHQDRSDKLGEPMSHDCCGTSLCVDAPPATTDAKVTVAAPQEALVVTVTERIPATVGPSRRVQLRAPSPPLDTGSRLALLATLLI
ncbi:MAG: hypothetical protein WA208_13780 [Thermoanaerobaculia bacterium]